MPKGQVEVVLVTKQSVARSQLETAIGLWFNEGDPVSIHTLAVAAHDCLNALVRHVKRRPSYFQTWMKQQSKGFQKRAREAQNFFKHGYKKPKSTIQYSTIDAEVLMMDAVGCYELLFDKPTPLMRIFSTRFLYEHPAIITEEALPIFAKNAEVHQLVNSTRKEFFEKLFVIFSRRYDSQFPPGATSPGVDL